MPDTTDSTTNTPPEDVGRTSRPDPGPQRTDDVRGIENSSKPSASDQCYRCVHRRDVPGSAHSACVHPVTDETRRSQFMQLAGLVGKRGGAQLTAMAQECGEGPQRAADTLHIQANFHGIRNGWFIWPVNFDPVWLERCDGFEVAKAEGR